MKKPLFLSLLLLGVITSGTIAQESALEKKSRFGIYVSPSIDWQRSGNSKKFENYKSAFAFEFGLITQFRLTSAVSFYTGIGGLYDRGSLQYNGDSASYYLDPSQNIVEVKSVKDPADALAQKYTLYQLKSRKLKSTFVKIPIALKMMTNDIAGIKYFALFGGNIGILTKAKAFDNVKDLSSVNQTEVNIDDIDVKKDCNFLKFELNFGAGIEYNLSGNTALLVQLTYHRGIIPITKDESRYLIDTYQNGSFTKLKHPSYADGIGLGVGFLF